MDISKLQYDGKNSCYIDSLFIFILLYKDTPFFAKFYKDIHHNKHAGIADNAKQIPRYFNDLYNNVCIGTATTTSVCRTNIRQTLNEIGKLFKKKPQTKRFERDWLSSQQDSSELLEFLMYIYDINTIMAYNRNNCYEYKNTNITYEQMNNANCTKKFATLSENHLADYVNDKFSYHITIDADDTTDFYSNQIYTIDNMEGKPLSSLKFPDALIIFNRWNVINLTNRKNYQRDTDKFILVNYKIKSPPPIFIIQINRLFINEKNHKEFNNNFINMPEYIVNPNNNTNKYILVGGTVHSGGAHGGHYTAYILNPATDTYFFYDDMGTLEPVGNYEKLTSHNNKFKNYCTLLFYILESDYNTQKSRICRVTQPPNKESSSDEYHSASDKSNQNNIIKHEPPNQIPIPQTITLAETYSSDLINFIFY